MPDEQLGSMALDLAHSCRAVVEVIWSGVRPSIFMSCAADAEIASAWTSTERGGVSSVEGGGRLALARTVKEGRWLGATGSGCRDGRVPRAISGPRGGQGLVRKARVGDWGMQHWGTLRWHTNETGEDENARLGGGTGDGG